MVADQLTDNRVHGVMDRGDHSNISTCISKAIDNEFSGNMIDVCPVGALTDKTFRFKSAFGSTSLTMHTEIVTNVLVKQPFGCLETKFKE
jgi:predicted molibdopterin-dependent oxidoreductase YjgC